MIHPNRSLHWLALSCLSVLLLPKPVSDAGAATPSPLIQEIRMIGMVPQLTIAGEVGQTNWILYADEVAPQADWKVLTNVVVTQSPYVVVDAGAPPALQRFYEIAVNGGADPSSPTNMVWIPPGTFTMGSPSTEVDRFLDEEPQTQVTISRGFWMGECEVTQAEYQALIGSNPSWLTGNLKQPVDSVSWMDATNYCGKLTQQERNAGRSPAGYVYRLPTEAEWEYACRAGTTTRFSYGDDPSYTNLTNYAWYWDNSGETTHPVGQKFPNPWGLYDMHGNVSEWCQDWYYGAYPGGSVTDPRGPGEGEYRVIRRGCWFDNGEDCRSASRAGSRPGFFRDDRGFRVVLAPGP